jgi:F-type H+-transporting ATPase subunit b
MATSGEPEPFATSEGVIHETAAEHKVFPPFDSTTYASQFLWFVITFVALYWLMAKVALPRIAAILGERSGRIAGDLEAANDMKRRSEEAGVAYEKALADARANANRIAEGAREESKAAAQKQRTSLEADLNKRLAEAEARIDGIKQQAVSQVGMIAADTAEAVVAAVSDLKVSRQEIDAAVASSMGR